MIRQLIILLSLFLVFNCSDNSKPKKPDNLISKDKMSDILYDLYIINSAKGVNRNLLQKKGVIPEEFILKKHKIDSTQFANSNAYYSYDTEVYRSIVNQAKNRIQTLKDSLDTIQKEKKEKQKKKRDSLRKLKQNTIKDKAKKLDTIINKPKELKLNI